MLYTRNLVYAHPNGHALLFPDMECAAGDVLLITGGSGVGKTTLLHLLAGLLKPAIGEIHVAGTAIQSMKPAAMDAFRGKHIGIIYQQSHFIASLSVRENLLLVSKNTRLQEISEKLGIQQLLHKKPAQLSQGEQQRASITRALLQSPQLLLADEPTASLDDENCIAVAKLLAAQAAEQRAALLIVTHDNRLKQLFAHHITLS
ncbi:ATP-binding cassette domain-containing protein [Chitinophaga sp. SYP-B3965]|uniref:ABC transporter ATP-binding protein n=1 Tax=Chitinophaga sp. SYP-B3965 TaxID=2663120 RepID=UPI001299C9F4|nr:ATP-binding cassette domain-containing protein [Chitinophaga sp. SYP-B3965]MRG46751.1 ATP-binding cassette domain-containing protein [Chitinophaga sp. SYP-B3965]